MRPTDNENSPLGAIHGLKPVVLRSSLKGRVFGIENFGLKSEVLHHEIFNKRGIERFGDLVEKYKDYLIIAEGKKDKKALEGLGFKKVKILDKALYKIVEEVGEEVGKEGMLILTDLDKEGKKLYGRLNSALRGRGVKVENELRNFLLKNSKVRQVEGLKKLGLEHF